MGHRSIYAIRRDGAVELYSSHWGALTVPQDIFWGPAWAEAFIRALEKTDEWLDDVWAEGAVALDFDEQRVTFYGGELYDAMDVVEALMGVVWGAAWTVRYDASLQNVAASVGVAAERVTAPPTRFRLPLARIGENLAKGMSSATLVLTRRDGKTHEGVVDFVITAMLENGVDAFLAKVPQLPPLAAVRANWQRAPRADRSATFGDALEVVLIDVDARTLRFAIDAHERDGARLLVDTWPGWTIHADDEFAAVLAAAGRAPDEDMTRTPVVHEAIEPRDLDDRLADIEAALFGAEAKKANVAAFAQRALASIMGKEKGAVQTAPGFLDVVPTVSPDVARQRELFARAVATVRAHLPE